jgi:hypothetical protein
MKKFKNDKVMLVYSNYYILNQTTGLKKIFYKKDLPEGIIYKNLLKKYFIGIKLVRYRYSITSIDANKYLKFS